MTRGAVNRSLKKMILPGYGEKNKGYYSSIKKSLYNKVYDQTTLGISDIIDKTDRPKRGTVEYYERQVERNKRIYENQKKKYERLKERLQQIEDSKVNLEEVKNLQNFIEESKQLEFIHSNKTLLKSFDRLHSYSTKYATSSSLKKENLFVYLKREISNLMIKSSTGRTQYECQICLDIISLLGQNKSSEEVLSEISGKYEDLYLLPLQRLKNGK